MERDLAILDMQSGDEVEGFYVLSRAEVKKTSAGKPYLNARLTDCTGGIQAKMWDFGSVLQPEDVGRVVLVRGNVTEFNGALQFTMNYFRPANERDRYNLDDLVASAPIDVQERMAEIHRELLCLQAESNALMETISKNWEEMGK